MQRKIFGFALLLSLLLHFMIFFGLYWVRPHVRKSNEAVEITLVAPPKTQPKQQEIDRSKQIVDQSEKSVNDEIAPDAKYLSRHNQHIVHESKAAQHGIFKNSDNGVPSPQQNAKTAMVQKQSQAKKMRTHGAGALPTLKDLMPNYDWSTQTMASKQGNGPSQTDDFLKDTPTGAETLLNTREFIYFTYYERIKNKLRQYWEPKIKEKISHLLAQGRSIASSNDRVTKMIIILDAKGTLIGVQIISESGVRDLDDAAVEAFRAAAPFPNPPAGIVDPDGTIKIRWDFILEA